MNDFKEYDYSQTKEDFDLSSLKINNNEVRITQQDRIETSVKESFLGENSKIEDFIPESRYEILHPIEETVFSTLINMFSKIFKVGKGHVTNFSVDVNDFLNNVGIALNFLTERQRGIIITYILYRKLGSKGIFENIYNNSIVNKDSRKNVNSNIETRYSVDFQRKFFCDTSENKDILEKQELKINERIPDLSPFAFTNILNYVVKANLRNKNDALTKTELYTATLSFLDDIYLQTDRYFNLYGVQNEVNNIKNKSLASQTRTLKKTTEITYPTTDSTCFNIEEICKFLYKSDKQEKDESTNNAKTAKTAKSSTRVRKIFDDEDDKKAFDDANEFSEYY